MSGASGNVRVRKAEREMLGLGYRNRVTCEACETLGAEKVELLGFQIDNVTMDEGILLYPLLSIFSLNQINNKNWPLTKTASQACAGHTLKVEQIFNLNIKK